MAGFLRRFTSMPDAATIDEVNGIIIVDEAPEGSIASAGTGTVALVGEYEDGPFAIDATTPATPYDQAGGPTILDASWSQFGTFGFLADEKENQYPCARKSGGELWNGNAYIQAKGLPFRRLVAVRVDTSIGFVRLTLSTTHTRSITIAAGTVVSANNAQGSRLVTMQTVTVPAGFTGDVDVRVRPALDDGTFAGAASGDIDTIETPISLGTWTVTNPDAITGALNDTQIDARYGEALDTTLGISGVTREINYIVSARQSHTIRLALIDNAIQASAGGCRGRKARIAPPLGTTLQTMEGNSDPGVGAYRAERCSYSPGWTKYVREIATQGHAGGVGFTGNGLVETHGDIVLAALDSLLPPEESSAQATDLIPRAIYRNVESSLAAWGIKEYARAKAAGISAPRFHLTEGPQYEDALTTVDRASQPGRVDGNRLKMADYIGDSLAEFESPYAKKLGTESRIEGLFTSIEAFCFSHREQERIAEYQIGTASGPTPKSRIFTVAVNVIPTMDQIINRLRVGTNALTVDRNL